MSAHILVGVCELACVCACGLVHAWCPVSSRHRIASLAKYAPLFDEQGVTFEGFLDFNEEMLMDMGIVTFGAKRRILRTVCELRVSTLWMRDSCRLSHNKRFP